ncbi:MAG: hypothetical protein HF962_04940 [Sulfurovum sp.]|nr:hypothetical protein [Sulfurovum sp.]
MKCFETIHIENAKPRHLKYHNYRLNKTRQELFGINRSIDIANYLTGIPSQGLYRAKVIYDDNNINTNYYIYKAKNIQTFRLIETNIDYRYKYLDRTQLDSLRETHQDSDELIILNDGLVTDTTISNIALRENGIWYTPAKPLLGGTTRARLLDEDKLHLRNIKVSELAKYDGLALMNAMIGFKIISDIKLIIKDSRATRDISY